MRELDGKVLFLLLGWGQCFGARQLLRGLHVGESGANSLQTGVRCIERNNCKGVRGEEGLGFPL